jgi:hypothetical protein
MEIDRDASRVGRGGGEGRGGEGGGGGMEMALGVQDDDRQTWEFRPGEKFTQLHPSAGVVTVRWALQSHLTLMKALAPRSVKVVVFNLGYLPGGDKSIVTVPEVTLATIGASRSALQEGGCISATCYPGHEEGQAEEAGILEDARSLPVEIWSCYLHQWLNQRNKKTGKRAPSLVLYQRTANDP